MRRALTPHRHPRAGAVLAGSGIVVAFCGLVMVCALRRVDSLTFTLAALSVIAGGYLCWFVGAGLAAPSGEALLTRDRRAPIVFLRSFADERRDKTLWGFLHTLWGAFVQRQVYLDGSGKISPWGPIFQWQLRKLFSEFGPYVAIGRPGERIAEMGAAKMYVADDTWQTTVGGLLRRARITVLRPGRTAGLRWELRYLRQHVPPARVLLIVPIDVDDYRAFCRWANQELPRPLPERKPRAHFLVFRPDWTPQELVESTTLWNTLDPFLTRNGLTRAGLSLGYRLLYDMPEAQLSLGLLIVAVAYGLSIVLF